MQYQLYKEVRVLSIDSGDYGKIGTIFGVNKSAMFETWTILLKDGKALRLLPQYIEEV